uniref:NADH-ubiquinone oxidoreductase chain 3 n=1 Tax=Southwellina hispida TaxID=449650 RepID=A0A0C4MWG3_9BILA|nr:NADH dehydrogenase subunit 3 [Southwellina hispida]AIO11159.1 NADH dehydrogenase subunit 3 [Southwellina hispida]
MEIILVVLVVVLMVGFSLIISVREDSGVGCDSSFESGYMELSEEMSPISVRFFVLGVVFLLLDLETAIIIATPFSLGCFVFSFYLGVIFLIWVYMLGTIYEWYMGSLDWFS